LDVWIVAKSPSMEVKISATWPNPMESTLTPS